MQKGSLNLFQNIVNGNIGLVRLHFILTSLINLLVRTLFRDFLHLEYNSEKTYWIIKSG